MMLRRTVEISTPELELAPPSVPEFLAPPTNPMLPASPRPKVGVVLGSGGIKAFAGVALFEFLKQAEIAVDLLVGCSGGSVICAGIGAGYAPEEIRKLAFELLDSKLFEQRDYRSLLGLVSPRLGRFDKASGLLKPDGLREIYRRQLPGLRLENLRPRTLIQTTDLLTGEGVVLSQGSAADAVYASGAFFPVLPPLYHDGRWLADGVYSAPVPVLEAVKRNLDVIIVLDFNERVTSEPQGFLECFHRYVGSAMTTLKRSQMLLALELHHYEIIVIEVRFDHSVRLRDVAELPAIFAAGEEAVDRHKAEILSALRNFQGGYQLEEG